MNFGNEIFRRTELLGGSDVLQLLSQAKVLLFGVGGVGSWCAECLIRSGVRHLTIVDSDRVAVTNINRQLMATSSTVGQVKVEVLKKRLLEINPDAEITALQKVYSAENSAEFPFDSFDYTIDAIDSLSNKAHLILTAAATTTKLFCSMGAALKIDPTKIAVAEFWKVHGDPLGAALRKKFRRAKVKPAQKILCVYSSELLDNRGDYDCYSEEPLASQEQEAAYAHDGGEQSQDWSSMKAQINGTFAHITATFGFYLAGLVVQDVYAKALSEAEK